MGENLIMLNMYIREMREAEGLEISIKRKCEGEYTLDMRMDYPLSLVESQLNEKNFWKVKYKEIEESKELEMPAITPIKSDNSFIKNRDFLSFIRNIYCNYKNAIWENPSIERSGLLKRLLENENASIEEYNKSVHNYWKLENYKRLSG